MIEMLSVLEARTVCTLLNLVATLLCLFCGKNDTGAGLDQNQGSGRNSSLICSPAPKRRLGLLRVLSELLRSAKAAGCPRGESGFDIQTLNDLGRMSGAARSG